ncbi:sulfurtransferase complex subunit TusC [Pseudomonas sp. Irchel 3E20]|uniref:sulfurtransferase complex subunit TusC n=1 Tax=Pseudomonas sp. Irchel 3E20 TaxID=2008983 RepID=UPI000BA3B0E9|nr:sulfurtransferase complex subunit TusC [Pseudomonas sp. Irchel 3E20]
MAKSLLIVSRQAPWSGPGAREALDIVLAGGAFGLPIGLLFLDDGVFQVATRQEARALEQKDLSANLQALELFGVEEVYLCRTSAAERGLHNWSLEGLQALNAEQIRGLFDSYDQVITL